MTCRVRKTNEQFVREVCETVGDEYIILSKYEGSSIKVGIYHAVCGHEYKVRPNDFKKGRRCPKCSGKVKKDTKYFKAEVKKLAGNEFEVLGEYTKSGNPILMKHSLCGNTLMLRPNDFVRGVRCSKCYFKSKRKPQIDFEKEINKILSEDYKVLSEYINMKTKVKMRHIVCGNEFYMRPDTALRGSGCPKCNESKGERKVEIFLIHNFYSYKTQYGIKKCRYERMLPFDFAVFVDNEILCLIEFNGKQHYESVEWWGGKKRFLTQKRRDSIKINYCKSNNIPLIIIPYWEKDVEGYLQNELDEIYKMKNIKSEQLSIH